MPIPGSVLKSSATSTMPVVERLMGQRPAGVEGDDLLELDAVDLAQPLQAQRPGRAFGRPAEGQLARHLTQVAQAGEPEPLRDLPTDDEGVGVLGGRGREGTGDGSLERPDEGGMGGRDVRLGMCPADAQELHRGPRVLGNHVDESLAQRGRDQFAWPEAECALHGEPGPVERLA